MWHNKITIPNVNNDMLSPHSYGLTFDDPDDGDKLAPGSEASSYI
jgi:hypothetical protein